MYGLKADIAESIKSDIFKNDIKELLDKKYYYSRRFADGKFNVIKPHLHQMYEVYYLLSGSRRFFVKNKFYMISQGDFVIVRPNVLHYTTAYNSDSHERIVINFTEEYLSDSIKSYVEGLCDKVCVSIGSDSQKKTEDILKRTADEYQNHGKLSDVMKKGLLTELLINVVREAQNNKNVLDESEQVIDNKRFGTNITVARKAESRIDTVMEFINDNPAYNITLDYAAALSGYSKSRFSKVFKDVTGFTFGNYLKLQRLFLSCRLLEKTNQSVTDIAYECGFMNSGYFSVVFKDYFNMSPLDYRKSKHGKDKI